MQRSNLSSVIAYVRRTAGGALAAQGLSDAQLVARFRSQQDAEAFCALVHRHGPLVRSVCRRVLRHDQDVEDAFQATFLVLAVKANSIRNVGSLASWLHGVSFRAAMNARRARRHMHQLADQPDPKRDLPVAAAALREAQTMVDEELNRLAEKYRAPFLLCCLEGLSRAEAAQQLGWKEGTVNSRTAQARRLLQQRLKRRGVVLSAALCAFDLTWSAAPAFESSLVQRTSQAALSFAADHVGAPGASAQAMLLARGLLSSMAIAAKMTVGTVFLIACGLLAATGAIASRAMYSPLEAANADKIEGWQPPVGVPPGGNLAKPGRMDVHADALPEGAQARQGTLRQRAPDSQIALSENGKEIVALSHNLVIRQFDASTGHLKSVARLPASQGFNGPWFSSRGTYALFFRSQRSTRALWNSGI